MPIYIALLRGINIGKHNKISMQQQQTIVESCGFENVKVVLNTGNIVFDAANLPTEIIEKMLQNAIEQQTGYTISVWVIPQTHLKTLVANCPWANQVVIPHIKYYMSLIKDETLLNNIDANRFNDASFQVVAVYQKAIFFTINALLPTTKAMDYLEKYFKKEITTRNWKTIQKLVS